jgi:hypothetical protein
MRYGRSRVPEHPAHVLAVGAGLATKARRVPGVADREVLLVQDLGRVERGERDLRRPDQVQLVGGRDVDVDLVGREERAAEHRLLADQDRRDHRDEPTRRQQVERVADERELDLHDVAEQIHEPGATGPSGPFAVEHAQPLTQLRVVLGFEVEGRGFAVAAHLDRVLVREPVGRRLVGDVRGPGQLVVELGLDLPEPRLELLELGRDLGHLRDQTLPLLALGTADRLARSVLLRAQLLHTDRERPPSLVELEDRVDGVGQVAPGEALAEPIGVLSDRPDVEHARPWPPGPRASRPSPAPRRPSAAGPIADP